MTVSNKPGGVRLALVLSISYLLIIAAANWAIAHHSPMTVWPWPDMVAPAGVWFAGVAFTLRDLLHEAGGRLWVACAIAAGAALSLLTSSPSFALASAAAFGLSEFADFAVYEPLRKQHWLGAVAASNAVGLTIDSALFLWLAFGSLRFLPGQVVGKAWMTVAAVMLLGTVRYVRRTRVA